jgi:uncharacterized membrane protein
MEVVLKYIQYHRFINRGFMIGPWCPIYGVGAVFITCAVDKTVTSYASYFLTFAVSFLLCGALEYAVSFAMEKLFHARWWDYSQKPLNLQGRVWIGNLILFGLGGIIIVKGFNPPFFKLLYTLPFIAVEIWAIAIAVLMIADCITSVVMFTKVREEIDGVEADNSEEISLKVREHLRSKHILLRRIASAYPNMVAKPRRILQAVKEGQQELARKMEDGKEELARRVEDGKEELARRVEDGKEGLARRVEDGKEGLARRVEDGKEGLARRVEDGKEGLARRVEDGKEEHE